MNNKNIILELSLKFALGIIEYSELLEERKKYVIAKQLLKSGTSIGANIREAQNAESVSDFLHKLKIAAKEAEETEYWLILCSKSASYPKQEDLLEKLIAIKKVLTKIISTTKKNYKLKTKSIKTKQ